MVRAERAEHGPRPRDEPGDEHVVELAVRPGGRPGPASHHTAPPWQLQRDGRPPQVHVAGEHRRPSSSGESAGQLAVVDGRALEQVRDVGPVDGQHPVAHGNLPGEHEPPDRVAAQRTQAGDAEEPCRDAHEHRQAPRTVPPARSPRPRTALSPPWVVVDVQDGGQGAEGRSPPVVGAGVGAEQPSLPERLLDKVVAEVVGDASGQAGRAVRRPRLLQDKHVGVERPAGGDDVVGSAPAVDPEVGVESGERELAADVRPGAAGAHPRPNASAAWWSSAR
jgi:hypothetical protein